MDTALVAAAGEYYVLSHLCLKGYIAALAPKGVPNTDIIVTDPEGSRRFDVQVKARLGKGHDKGWHMSKKHQRVFNNLFYCFVDFEAQFTFLPATYIVPSRVVAEALAQMHQVWLSVPGKKNQERKDSDFRRFMPDYSVVVEDLCGSYGAGWLKPYSEAWDSFPSDLQRHDPEAPSK